MELLTRFKSAIVEFDVTQSQLGAYADMKNSRVSRGSTGEVPFDAAESKVIEETILAMRELQNEVRPEGVPVNWALIHKVKPLVDQRRRELRDHADPVVRRAWYVRLNSLTWLARMRGNEPVPTYNYQVDGACFEDVNLAEETAHRLRAIGIASKMEMLTSDRRASTITRNLIEIGFESAAIGGNNESTETAA